jgi:hypothetical protein
MHIENANFHINLGGGPIAAAALAALLGRESADTEPASPGTLPLIGDSWPSVDGIFAGIARPKARVTTAAWCCSTRSRRKRCRGPR